MNSENHLTHPGHILLLQNVRRYISLLPEEEAYFLSLFQEITIKRKQYFLYRGEVCHQTAFVIRGCLRSYIIDSNGFEHILSFAPADWWMGDMYSYNTQNPGYLYIDALADTQVLVMNRAGQEELFVSLPQFERYFRILTEKSLVSYQQRTLDSLSLTAQQRYLGFCSRYPSLINSLPQKAIASYIGVTPEFLSKLRKDLQKKAKG